MENLNQVNAVRFHNVGFSTEGITLFDQGSTMLFQKKTDIRKITLKYGFQSERPLIEVVFGVGLILIGFYFIMNFILHVLINRIAYLDMLLSILLLPVGIWFAVDGFRKRFYFEVTLDNDKRKFPLSKNPDKGELQKFILIALQFGYTIDAVILNKYQLK